MNINTILSAKTLHELLAATQEFCKKAIMSDSEHICFDLKEQIKHSDDNEYLVILSSYMSVAEDGDEIIEALYEFMANCKGFVEADEEMVQQVTKEEFESALSECEEKCNLKTCIDYNHNINIAEVPLYNQYREFGLRFKNNTINLFLPKITINKNTKEYISEELGLILYNILITKLDEEYIRKEMYKYIPEIRNEDIITRQLFKKYFYHVVLYQKIKPGIYNKYDDQMRSVIILEFFKNIISAYLHK